MSDYKIMAIDDEEIILDCIKDFFEEYDIKTFQNPLDAKIELNNNYYDIVISDYKMPGLNGLELLLEGKKNKAYHYGILLTAYAEKQLLEDFINKDLIKKVLEKPLNLELLKEVVDAAILECKQKNEQEAEILNIKTLYNTALDELNINQSKIIGINGGLKKVYQQVEMITDIDENVLLLGETGAGKDIIARTIHTLSKRKNKSFIKINCGALPENLIESELFGYNKGAFSGAYQDKPGKIELANQGTLFFDEIGELRLDLQTRLLHVIQDKVVERLGSNKVVSVDFRLVCATNKNLEDLVKKGLFREDLYYRISTFPIHIPALRERVMDLNELIGFLIDKYSKELGLKSINISKNALQMLKEYSWPGNIRELENVIKRAIILLGKGNNIIEADSFKYLFYSGAESRHDLNFAINIISGEVIENKSNLKNIEKKILSTILSCFDGKIMEAVRQTGIPKDRFYRHIGK